MFERGSVTGQAKSSLPCLFCTSSSEHKDYMRIGNAQVSGGQILALARGDYVPD